VACDPNYDLAVLKFTIEQTETSKSYIPLALATSNLSINDKVIALGQPKGQKNTITLGNINGFANPTITVDPNVAMSNVEFSVYRHNAPIAGGSSGGALIDYNYKIVGINYASSADSSGNYLYTFAIPIEKVKEFLTLYNLPY
jgi:S1-C subfamily serine protease